MSVINRFSTTDRIILCGSAVILALLSYLLYDDSLLFPSATRKDKAIGTLSSSSNDVRKKSSDNFVWIPGNDRDQVYENDSIFTGDGSKASITLNDGSEIQISENSLVNLHQKNGEMELDLRFGQFEGNGNAPIKIKSGGEEYVIQGKNAKFEINRSKTGALDVKVLSGNAEITGKAGKQTLKSNESLQISKKGVEKSQADAKILLITKNDISMHRNSDKVPLKFEWDGRGNIDQYNFELSKTEDFKKVLNLQTTDEETLAYKEALKEGSYFWRVKGLDFNQKVIATSAVQKFYLSILPAPKVVAPIDKTQLKATTLPGAQQATTQVTWEGDTRHAQFQWQLSATEDFTKVLAEKTLNEKQITTPTLTSGTYYTRVRGFDKDKRPSLWSKAHSFTYNIEAEEKPPAPILVEKRIKFLMPKLDGRMPSAETSPQVAWKPVSVAKDYQWQLSKSGTFAGVPSQVTTNTRVAWTQYRPGKYYYRVFSRTALGQNSDPSEVGVMEIFADAPTLNPIPATLVKETNLNAVPLPKDVNASWSPIADATSYVLQVDKDKEFKNPSQQLFSGTDGIVNMPTPGKYYVRVKALNESNQDMSEFSNVQEALYIFRKTLKSPALIEPYDKTTLFLQKDMEPLIWLEWSSVPDAVKYTIEASTASDFSRIVFTKSITETRYLIREKIPYGNIYWRVRAIGVEESLNSEWTQREFMIFHQKNSGF